MQRDREASRDKTPGVKHTVAIAGQSILLNANAPNFGAMYVMLDDFHKRAAAGSVRRRHRRQAASELARRDRRRRGQRLRRAAGRRAWAPPAASRSSSKTAATPASRRCKRSPTTSSPTAQRHAGPARSVHQLPGQHALAVPRHRPRPRQDDGRLDGRGVQHAAGLPRLALRQRLQPLRPHLAGQRPGRAELPQADRRSEAAEGPQRASGRWCRSARSPQSATSAARC